MVMLLASMTAGCAADNPQPSRAVTPSLETVVRYMHPAGPTTVRTWRSSADAPPYRIELQRARSGRLLIGQARLLNVPGGQWFIVNATGLKLPLPAETPSAALAFEESGQRWLVRVLKRDTPIATPGIATEGEASLDLLLERQP